MQKTITVGPIEQQQSERISLKTGWFQKSPHHNKFIFSHCQSDLITEILEQQDADIRAAHKTFRLYPVELTALAFSCLISLHLKKSWAQNGGVVSSSFGWVRQNCAQIWHARDPITDPECSTSDSSRFKSHMLVSRLSLTSNLGIIGHAHSTDPVVGRGCHLSGTSRPVPDEEGRDGGS